MAIEKLTYGLSSNILEDFQKVFKKFPTIDQVLIFGSRAKGTWKDGSDIDLAVIAPNLSEIDFTKLWNEIDALPLIFKVDCLHWDRLPNQILKDKIIQEGKIFYP